MTAKDSRCAKRIAAGIIASAVLALAAACSTTISGSGSAGLIPPRTGTPAVSGTSASRSPATTSVAPRTSAPSSPSASRSLRTTHVFLEDVRAGDCFQAPDADTIDALDEVPCSQAHDAQVFHIYQMKAGPYPGDDPVYQAAMDACHKAFLTHVNTDAADAVTADALTPEKSSWAYDRSVLCYLYRLDGAQLGRSLYRPS